MMKSSAPTTPPAVTAVTAVSLSGQESTFLSSVYNKLILQFVIETYFN